MTAHQNIDRTVGRLEAQIEALKGQIEELKDIIQQQGRDSATDRKGLAKDIAESRDRLHKLEDVITDIEPLARDFGRLREKSSGFIYAMILVWTLIGGLLLWIGERAWTWVVGRIINGGG